jgi:hypothetical protein
MESSMTSSGTTQEPSFGSPPLATSTRSCSAKEPV